MSPPEHWRAYASIARGDLDVALTELGALAAHGDPSARAWALAARAAGALVDPFVFGAPSIEELAEHRGAELDVRAVAALACAHVWRTAALGFETEQLEQLLALHEELAHGAHPDSEVSLWLVLGRSWLAWLRGAPGDHGPALEAVERSARASQWPALVIDAGALRALSAEAAGDTESMLSLARRASRMARTEALAPQEYLAHLVLARARRAALHPHLAMRILGSLDRLVADSCRAWVRWERLLAGDAELLRAAHAPRAATRAERAALALASTLSAALAGNQDAFRHAEAALMHAVRGLRFAEAEAREVLAALDARAAVAGRSERLAAWCAGRDWTAPASIHGLCTRIDASGRDESEAIVLAEPSAPPRRVLGLAAALSIHAPRVRLRRTSRRQGRVETLAAVLACAGAEGLSDAECFLRVYEMPCETESHRGAFEVLVTRTRLYVRDVGEILRGQGRISLQLREAVAVPDPRCAAPPHDRLLRLLAQEGRGVTASDAASKLGLSVRAVQLALRELGEDGVCVAQKDGRYVAYALEDTTFSEPTQRLYRRRA